MSLNGITDAVAVRAAMEEYRALGREAFLRRYDFGPSRQYVVVADGRRYDAKALVGAAHGYQHPELGPLDHTAFSGGVAGAHAVLERLEFEVSDLEVGNLDLERRWRDEAYEQANTAGEELAPE